MADQGILAICTMIRGATVHERSLSGGVVWSLSGLVIPIVKHHGKKQGLEQEKMPEKWALQEKRECS